MTRRTHSNTLFVLTLVISTGLGAAAFADSHKGRHKEGGKDHMMHMMQDMHDRMHGNDRPAMMDGQGKKGSKGSMRKHGMMSDMKKMLDANGDGKVTPEEASAQLRAKLREFDADGDGSLSIAEYEALHSAMIREKMVDRFQHLDADGDGRIMPGEMNAPADKMKRMQKKRAMMHSGKMSGRQGDMDMGQSKDDTIEN